MSKRKAYYAKSMVVARATGIPYRQNDMMLSKDSGRILVRSQAAEQLEMSEEDYAMLCGQPGRLAMVVRRDQNGLLGQHVKKVEGQQNMQWNQRSMVRQWCMAYKTSQLRLRVKSVVKLKNGTRLVEMEKVDDMCEMFQWASRAKK